MKNITIILVFFIGLLTSCGGDAPVDNSENALVRNLDSLIVDFPDSIDLLLERGSANFDIYEYEKALPDLAKAFRLDSNNLKSRLLYAELLNNRTDRSLEDIVVARRHYETVINKDPKNTRALIGLASTHLFFEDYKRTFQYVNEALRIDPKLKNAYVLKGTTYMKLGNIKLAKSSYETAIQQAPEFYEAYFLLGQIYQSENDKKCIDYFVTAQKLKPENLEFKYQVAFSKETFGLFEEAKQMYREMASDTVDVYVSRGLFHQGYIKQFNDMEIDSAIYYYKSALQTEPRFVEAWYNLGICLEEQGNRSKALAAYANCLKYNPEFEVARTRANKLR